MAIRAGKVGLKRNEVNEILQRLEKLEKLFTVEDPQDGDTLIYDATDETFKNENA